MYFKRASKLSILTGALVLAGAILPKAVHAANTCNGFIALNYTSSQTFSDVGDMLTVTMTMGTGNIGGGTKATVNRVRFEMDCDAGSPLGIGCVDDGAIITYLGDSTIVTDCPRAFATGHGANTSPNQLVFTPATPFDIPAGNPSFCNISFGIAVAALSDDITPGKVEEVTGYSAANADMRCDNNLASAGSQSGSILLCPSCNDNNLCTQDTCNRDTGVCSNTNIVFCDDSNACTTDRCVPATGNCENLDTKTAGCNDNNACTTDSCDPATGNCLNPDTKTAACNDNNACTTDRCVPATGACENIDTKTATCNDNNACTTDTCDTVTGACKNIDTKTPTCNDNNACTTDTCDTATGNCSNVDTKTPTCNDNNACTTDTCDTATGNCSNVDTKTPTCNDNNACTTDTCDTATGNCSNVDTKTPTCNDNNACTTDTCDTVTGNCKNVDAKTPTCNDNNACTTDTCDTVTGNCKNVDTKTPTCNDNNACTTDTCDTVTGNCKNVDTKTPTCNDNNACTTDTCDTVTGACKNIDTKTPTCNDNNACTTDTCDTVTGACKNVDTKTPTCNDNNACTTDSCNPATGACRNIDTKTPTCGDNNACTTDSCDPTTGACKNIDTKTPTCGDNNACTTDSCDPATGACKNIDTKTPTCGDNNACTTDSCNPATGACKNVDNKTPTCNDYNACTTDTCDPATGQCKYVDTKTATCGDNNACTTDTCDPGSGACVHTGTPAATLDFRGNTATSGTLGNIRTFTAGSLSVKASAFTRTSSNGSWATAYLGSYSGGLGVTTSAEGNGGNDSHTIDNVGGQKDYVLLEFNQSVTIDQARLGYIATAAGFGPDSDLSLWIGTKTNPFTSHNTLSDAFLTSLGAREDNNTTLTTVRTADVNAGAVSGNVIVIAASTSDTNPKDGFKLQHILTGCPSPCPPSVTLKLEGNTATTGTKGNIRTFTTGSVSVKASAFTRNSNTGTWATSYLGAYGGGLGVTSSAETGNNDSHTVDNVGGERNYVLLEFNGTVVLDQVSLGYIATAAGFGPDSDLAVWIGTKTNPYTSHNTLSDAFLTSLGGREDNDTTLSSVRTADVNAAGVRGNVVVISASVADTTPDDGFKIKHLLAACPQP